MAFRALRRTAAEIHEQPPAELDRSASRRRFLTRAAAGGATLAVGAAALPVLVPAAGAQDPEDGGTTGTTPGTTAADAPVVSGDPPVVEGADLTTVVTLQSIELAIVEIYDAMIATAMLAPATAETARQFRLHHVQHAAALAELAGGAATTEANTRLAAEVVPLMENAGDQTELATLAYNLEENVTATYLEALGELESFRASGVASKILPVDSQHAIVWSQVMVPDTGEWATEVQRWIPNFQSQTGAIDLAEYAAS